MSVIIIIIINNQRPGNNVSNLGESISESVSDGVAYVIISMIIIIIPYRVQIFLTEIYIIIEITTDHNIMIITAAGVPDNNYCGISIGTVW